MADEEKDQEGGEEGKKSKSKLIIILAVVLLAGGGGAFFAMQGGGGEAAEQEASKKEAVDLNLPGAVYPLEVFIVNLGVKGSFLKVAVNLEFYDPDPPPGIDGEVPRIRDSIIRVLSSKTSAEILTNEGKDTLRKEVMEAANTALDAEEVADVFFTEFIVQ